MTLQKQIVQIPFQGLQTKVDPKLAAIGTFGILDNWVIDRFPELKKRPSLQTIGASTTPSNITTDYTLESEIGLITNNALYAYSAALDQFLIKGYTASPVISSKAIISNTYTQTVCDSCISSNSILGTIWEDSRGGVRYSIKDLVNDSFLSSDISLSTTGSRPKTIASGTYIFFIWCEASTTSLNIVRFNTLTNTASASQTILNTMATTYAFDVIGVNSNILIAALTTTASPNALKGYYWNVNNNVIGSSTNGLQPPTSLAITNADTSSVCVSLAVPTGGAYIICSVFNSSKYVYTKPFNLALGAIQSETKVNTAATTDAGYALSSCCDSSNNTYLFYSTYNTQNNSFMSKISNNITTQTPIVDGIFILQMGIASKAFWYSGNAYVILNYVSANGLQNTYFGVRNDGSTWGRLYSTLASSISRANSPTSITLRPDRENTYIAALLKTTQIVASANSFFSQTSVFTEQINFTPTSIDNKVLGQNLNIAGGYLKQYDGSSVFEQGFHLYPESPTLVPFTGVGLLDTHGSYSYIAVWEWSDNQGQIHRSNTSSPSNITLTGTDDSITVSVRTLPITDKQTRFNFTRTPAVLAIYRTLNGGTNYYRVNQLPASFVYNDTQAQTIAYTDVTSDAALQSNSLLYTTGDVFSNITTPACNILTVAKNRVVLGGSDTQPNQLFISNQLQAGLAVNFANENSIIIDSYGGAMTALAAMDDKILIFKQSVLYYIAGEGPDATGSNGQFTTPLLISSDCGCVYPQSIVLTGLGVMFLSPKGLYLCDRNLNVSYIGSPVDSLTQSADFQITSAINLPDRNRVYFTTNNNQVIVYETFFDFWHTHTLPFTPISSTYSNNTWYCSSDTAAYTENATLAYDGQGQAISSTIQTNWISFGQLNGNNRIYDILLEGFGSSNSHQLVAEISYDFEDHPTEVLSIKPLTLLGNTYGTGATYGSDSNYGGSTLDTPYTYMIRPKRQKCSAIQIKIYDKFPDGSRNVSFRFSGLSFVMAQKVGYNKMLSNRRRMT